MMWDVLSVLAAFGVALLWAALTDFKPRRRYGDAITEASARYGLEAQGLSGTRRGVIDGETVSLSSSIGGPWVLVAELPSDLWGPHADPNTQEPLGALWWSGEALAEDTAGRSTTQVYLTASGTLAVPSTLRAMTSEDGELGASITFAAKLGKLLRGRDLPEVERLAAISREAPLLALRTRALAKLAALDPARAHAVATELLADDPHNRVDIVVEAAGSARDALALIRDEDAELGARLRSLAWLEQQQRAGTTTEARLHTLLSARQPLILARVIETLGRLGSVRSVEALVPLRDSDARPAPVRRAASEAITAIQARLDAPAEGSLSLAADTAAGALSAARPSAGALSEVAPTSALRRAQPPQRT